MSKHPNPSDGSRFVGIGSKAGSLFGYLRLKVALVGGQVLFGSGTILLAKLQVCGAVLPNKPVARDPLSRVQIARLVSPDAGPWARKRERSTSVTG